MKSIVTLFLAVFLGMSAIAESEKKVNSKVNNVTVFLQGAQVSRKAKVSVGKGITKVIMEGVTKFYNANSIQVKGKGDFIILDVSSRVFHPTPEAVKPSTTPQAIFDEIEELDKKVYDLQWEIKSFQQQIDAYTKEKNILMTSGVIKGQNVNDSILALKDAMTYMRLKLHELNGLILEAQRKQNGVQKTINEASARLVELRNYNANAGHTPKPVVPVQQIVITISADLACTGTVEATYMVPNAGWSPAYDLRANNISSPVTLTYKANVHQNTGVSWDNVNVKLSTLNPNQGNVKPRLAPWYIRFYQPIAQPVYSAKKAKNSAVKDMPSMALEMEETVEMDGFSFDDKLKEARHMSNFTQMNENLAMVEFELKIRHTIPSDGKTHLMAVAEKNVPAQYQHYIVPKMDKNAFLMAKLTDWEELNLLPAVANIYYDGTYVGQTRINPSQMTDTLELAFGRDRGIFMTRKKISDEEKVKKLSNEKEKTVTYELAIKNFKSGNVNVIIEDHIPVSLDDEIKVELLENSEAVLNKSNGQLEWAVKVRPKETRKYQFSYLLTYDKDKTLALN